MGIGAAMQMTRAKACADSGCFGVNAKIPGPYALEKQRENVRFW